MRIIVIGATGTIGAAVAAALGDEHDVVRASRKGEVRVDIEDGASIAALFDSVRDVDAVVCCAGNARFGGLAGLSADDFNLSIRSKLMGQVGLVRAGMKAVRDGGSFTLTSGVLSRHPMPGSAAISMVNAGLEAFALAAALELPRGLRVNVVSPPWVRETLEQMGRDGAPGMPAADVARAYVQAVEGSMNGTTIDARPVG